MSESELLTKISRKEVDSETLAGEVIDKPELLTEIFAGLNADKARVKYGSEKILRIISEKKPELLYHRIDFFIKNLDSGNNFFKLGAIHVLANLTGVDSDNKFDEIFDKYFAPIRGPVLMTAANVIAGAAKIASEKPALTAEITNELLKVETAQYQTDECRNIALGKTITSFDHFFNNIENKEPVIKLIKNQLNNTRNATRKKAERFLKKYKVVNF